MMNLMPFPADRIKAVYQALSNDKPHFDNRAAHPDEEEIKIKRAHVIYQAKTRHTLTEEDVGNFMRLFVGSALAAKYILPRAFEFWPKFYHEIISMIAHQNFETWTEGERKAVLEQLQFGLSHKAASHGHFKDQAEERELTDKPKDNLFIGKNEDQLFAIDPELALILCENFNLK